MIYLIQTVNYPKFQRKFHLLSNFLVFESIARSIKNYIFSFSFTLCHFVLVFFSIAITSLGEERANLSAFRTFVRFVLVWICRFPLPLCVWEGLRFVIVALPLSFFFSISMKTRKSDSNLFSFTYF